MFGIAFISVLLIVSKIYFPFYSVNFFIISIFICIRKLTPLFHFSITLFYLVQSTVIMVCLHDEFLYLHHLKSDPKFICVYLLGTGK